MDQRDVERAHDRLEEWARNITGQPELGPSRHKTQMVWRIDSAFGVETACWVGNVQNFHLRLEAVILRWKWGIYIDSDGYVRGERDDPKCQWLEHRTISPLHYICDSIPELDVLAEALIASGLLVSDPGPKPKEKPEPSDW